MSREVVVRAHVRSLELLDDAVLAMQSMSAHHFRRAREALLEARAYRRAIEDAVSALAFGEEGAPGAPARLLVVGAALGLCGSYHVRLVEAARAYAAELGVPTVDCIGARTAVLLGRAGLAAGAVYEAPSSVEAATRALLPVVDAVFADYRRGAVGRVHVVSARFGGVGEFEVARTRVLPLMSLRDGGPPRSPYVTARHARDVAVRERLFALLQELVLDALASEHGERLVATNAAGEWLERELSRTRRELRALTQEAATQEIVALVATSRRAKRPHLTK
jgi:F0F1-type ATP synthase gamma subunit